MVYEIDTSKPAQLNWTASHAERIVQNVRNLIHTWQYEVAYNRTLGVDPALLDKPADIAAVLYTAEVHRVVVDHEPRATVQEVEYLGVDKEGHMQFRVVVEV